MAARQQPVDGPRLLIISHDIVDARMAGPGIRYWELARVLAQHIPVTLAVPVQTALNGAGFALQAYQPGDWETLRVAVEHSDVLMPCGHTLASFPALTDGGQPIVIDGYDPFPVETLALFAGEPLERQHAHQQNALSLLRRQCLAGDFFVCASERQRDWWLGLLEAHGRINPRTFAADPTMRELVDVVPCGLPEHRPQRTRPVLKGVVPGIMPDDRVILWGGGIWEWLDPLTLIRAMGKVVQKRPDVRLVFPGTRHPNVGVVPDMPMRQRSLQLAQELGLLDKCVVFGDWVDYAEWPNYLLEADIGVSLHYDTLEAHLAFRTRVLDYIWAGLPMVVTRGDAAGDLVVQRGLGRVVDYKDVDGVAAAILELFETDSAMWQAGFGKARTELTWERVAEPLVAFCRAPHRAIDKQGGHQMTLTEVDLVERLQNRLVRQQHELARLRKLVTGYERGRFMRLMKWLHNKSRRLRRLSR
jgi:glycosyltransferase involved in cell wall biosynthesis